MPAPKGRVGRLQRRALSHVRPGPSRQLSSPRSVAHPFREPLRCTVTIVTVVTLPISTGFLCDGPLLEHPSTVTRIVTEKSPSLCGSLLRVTLVTLVAVDCRLFLDKSPQSLLRRLSYLLT